MTPLNYVIVVNDGGEMKSISASEIDALAKATVNEKGNASNLPGELDAMLNAILDARAIAAGEYDPSDNDTPFEVV